MKRMNTSQKVEFALKDQGRSKTWLAEKLGISRPTLYQKLKDNFWSVNEIITLNRLGILK